MPESMIEKVTKDMGDTLIPGSTTIQTRLVVSREMLGLLARAAIEALRTPTEAMHNAALAAVDTIETRDDLEAAYTAMLSAALKE